MEQTSYPTLSAGNENPEYILHPDKSRNITADVLSGSAIDYYDSFFDMYLAAKNSLGTKTSYANDINIAKNNYITVSLGSKSLKLKIAFDKIISETSSKTDQLLKIYGW